MALLREHKHGVECGGLVSPECEDGDIELGGGVHRSVALSVDHRARDGVPVLVVKQRREGTMSRKGARLTGSVQVQELPSDVGASRQWT